VRAEIKHLGVHERDPVHAGRLQILGVEGTAAIENQPVSSDIPRSWGAGNMIQSRRRTTRAGGQNTVAALLLRVRGFSLGVWDPCMVTLYSSFLDDRCTSRTAVAWTTCRRWSSSWWRRSDSRGGEAAGGLGSGLALLA